MRRIVACISAGLMVITPSAAFGTEMDGTDIQDDLQESASDWSPETSALDTWAESSDSADAIDFSEYEESDAETLPGSAVVKNNFDLGWNITIDVSNGENEASLSLDGGYYLNNQRWFSFTAQIPLQQEDGSVVTREVSVFPALVIDADSCYLNIQELAGAFDRLTGGTQLSELASIWAQDSWVAFPVPKTEEGEGLWDGILSSLQAWQQEGDFGNNISNVKGAFPKWWADRMIDSISGFLDVCEPTGLYELYQTMVQVPYDGTQWEQLVAAAPTAGELLHSWWVTISDSDYESWKETFFGMDEGGLSSQLLINTGHGQRGSAIYIRKLFDTELLRIWVVWDTEIDNMRKEQASIPWTISIDTLKENYLILMGEKEAETEEASSDEINVEPSETVFDAGSEAALDAEPESEAETVFQSEPLDVSEVESAMEETDASE